MAANRASITTSEDFTLMSPFGGKPSRGTYSNERWESIARFFRNGRASSFELVQAYRSADMVVLAAIERTHAEVGGLAGQNWALRVTLVFRKDKGPMAACASPCRSACPWHQPGTGGSTCRGAAGWVTSRPTS
jgi:ketosteroid isomerase-like protein